MFKKSLFNFLKKKKPKIEKIEKIITSVDILNPTELKNVDLNKKPEVIVKPEDKPVKIPHYTKTRISNGPWIPEKKLSREKMEKMRKLSQEYTIQELSVLFGVPLPAVIRILKSKWQKKD